MFFLAATTRRWNRRSSPSQRSKFGRLGAATVEMALVAPFILMIAFATIEFSRVIMIKQALTNSAREGCRFATLATTQSDAEVDSTVRQKLRHVIADPEDRDIVDVSVTPSGLNEVPSGTEISTRVEVRFSDVSWLPAEWAGNTVLIGSASMIRE